MGQKISPISRPRYHVRNFPQFAQFSSRPPPPPAHYEHKTGRSMDPCRSKNQLFVTPFRDIVADTFRNFHPSDPTGKGRQIVYSVHTPIIHVISKMSCRWWKPHSDMTPSVAKSQDDTNSKPFPCDPPTQRFRLQRREFDARNSQTRKTEMIEGLYCESQDNFLHSLGVKKISLDCPTRI